jgi:hypothetical protein
MPDAKHLILRIAGTIGAHRTVLATLACGLPFMIGAATTNPSASIVYGYVPETVGHGKAGATRVETKALAAESD